MFKCDKYVIWELLYLEIRIITSLGASWNKLYFFKKYITVFLYLYGFGAFDIVGGSYEGVVCWLPILKENESVFKVD